MAEGRTRVLETTEIKAGADVNRKKQGRGKGQSVSGRGRGSRVNDQSRIEYSASLVSTNGPLENSNHKVSLTSTCFTSLPYIFSIFCFFD